MAEFIAFVCEECGGHAAAPVEAGAVPDETRGCLCTRCLEALVAGGRSDGRPDGEA